MNVIQSPFRKENLQGICHRLDILAANPPQTLLMEGGSEEQRLLAGLYWAMTANCPTAITARAHGDISPPCLECQACCQIAANEFMDLRIYDGRISNTQDEEKPGPIRSLRIENIRNLKTVLGTSPHGTGKRVVIVQGLTLAREEAANSLLKILEEPSENTLFVLLASQRAQILPTLVSRSMCITLPWTDCMALPAEKTLTGEFATFLSSGSVFLERISAKGALDVIIAGNFLLECQKSLTRVAAGLKAPEQNMLDGAFKKLADTPCKLAQICSWIAEAQGMLQAAVNPVRIMEAFATKCFALFQSTREL